MVILFWELLLLINSWRIFIIELHQAINMTPMIDCQWVGPGQIFFFGLGDYSKRSIF